MQGQLLGYGSFWAKTVAWQWRLLGNECSWGIAAAQQRKLLDEGRCQPTAARGHVLLLGIGCYKLWQLLDIVCCLDTRQLLGNSSSWPMAAGVQRLQLGNNGSWQPRTLTGQRHCQTSVAAQRLLVVYSFCWAKENSWQEQLLSNGSCWPKAIAGTAGVAAQWQLLAYGRRWPTKWMANGSLRQWQMLEDGNRFGIATALQRLLLVTQLLGNRRCWKTAGAGEWQVMGKGFCRATAAARLRQFQIKCKCWKRLQLVNGNQIN